ncbi:hypothetical protein GCM10025868_09050 [Angustibacter aerolatus]|uniref:DNA polymerase III delta N-terminal domain-containing protein n=1 Tax=Angustibacter aerolatus TaxID=1162965 RepID=A0ABQ6JEP2_9ACTN|nr:hypothetical protein [Angustibacter aerolatus]GMA85655.1 hypothetical protein GCM10025868_09050 [Angustibacter aerolatus]
MTPPRARSRAAAPAAPADPSGPLHLVTGPEDLLAERAVRAVVEAARSADPATQVVDVLPGGYAKGDLAVHTSPSLFGESKVVVLHGLEDASDELITDARALVAAPVPDVVLVLRHRSGQRGKGLLDAARAAGAGVHQCAAITNDGERASLRGAGACGGAGGASSPMPSAPSSRPSARTFASSRRRAARR